MWKGWKLQDNVGGIDIDVEAPGNEIDMYLYDAVSLLIILHLSLYVLYIDCMWKYCTMYTI